MIEPVPVVRRRSEAVKLDSRVGSPSDMELFDILPRPLRDLVNEYGMNFVDQVGEALENALGRQPTHRELLMACARVREIEQKLRLHTEQRKLLDAIAVKSLVRSNISRRNR